MQSGFQAVKEVQKDFFDSLKQSLIFVLSCSTKILALLTARLALQGFAGDLISFEVGFAPSSSPANPYGYCGFL